MRETATTDEGRAKMFADHMADVCKTPIGDQYDQTHKQYVENEIKEKQNIFNQKENKNDINNNENNTNKVSKKIRCIDAEKAFDIVWHDGIRIMLLDETFPDKIIRWISSWLRNR